MEQLQPGIGQGSSIGGELMFKLRGIYEIGGIISPLLARQRELRRVLFDTWESHGNCKRASGSAEVSSCVGDCNLLNLGL